MSEQRDIKHEENLEAIHDLTRRIEALTAGVGATVQKHGEDIAVLKNDVSNLSKAGWFLFASSMGVVIAAFWKLVLRG